MLIDIKRLKRSFIFAFSGLKQIVKKEQNFRIHFIITLIVIVMGFVFQIRIWEWIILLLMIFLVMLLEIFNTVIERVVDILKPRVHMYVREIKDLMSAAVFIAALLSIIVGLLIFVPHIVHQLS